MVEEVKKTAMGTTTALLVIDVQLGMFESPLIPPVHDGTRLLAAISGLIEAARARGVPVIYVQHDGGKGHPLLAGTPPWQIHPAIRPHNEDVVVRKRFSDSFQETDLHDRLQSRGIEHLVVVGIQSEFCVDTTCRRAFSLGYRVTLVEDGHSTWDDDGLTAEQIIQHHNRTLGSQFATLAKSSSLFQQQRQRQSIGAR